MRAVMVMVAGGVVTIIGSLLPWVRTGDRRRNSYDVFAVVDRLGFAPDGAAATALRWWPVTPLLVAVATVGAWWGLRRPGGAVGVAAALYVGVTVALVIGAPSSELVDIEPGVVVTLIGAVVLLGGSVAAVVASWRRRPLRP